MLRTANVLAGIRQSELVRDFQNCVIPGPVRDLKFFVGEFLHRGFLLSYGLQQNDKQDHKDRGKKDYGHIDAFRKSMINETDPRRKEDMLNQLKHYESERDYFTASLRPINHLLQIDQNPNLELAEPRWELYKVSISFEVISKFDKIVN